MLTHPIEVGSAQCPPFVYTDELKTVSLSALCLKCQAASSNGGAVAASLPLSTQRSANEFVYLGHLGFVVLTVLSSVWGWKIAPDGVDFLNISL